MTTTTTREEEMRASGTRKKHWKPPALLETPAPPPGYSYRWIRTRARSDEDPNNVMKRQREGYEVVRPEELKGFIAPTLEHGRFAGVVGVGDLVLAKVPEYIAGERQSYYENRAITALQAVDNDLMKDNHPATPISRRYGSRVQFTRQRQPDFADDVE